MYNHFSAMRGERRQLAASTCTIVHTRESAYTTTSKCQPRVVLKISESYKDGENGQVQQ